MSDRLLMPIEVNDTYGYYKLEAELQSTIASLLKAQDSKTANYYEKVIIPGRMAEAYGKWSQESINVRKATAKELIEEIDQIITDCKRYACTCYKDCYIQDDGFTLSCLRGQQLKQKRGIK
jgi:hypothetical protein